MEPITLINKHKNLGLNIGIIIVALFIANSIFKSQNAGLEVLKKEKDAEAEKNEMLSKIGSLEKKIVSYKELYNKKEASSVIENIDNLAQESGVKIVSMNPEPEVASSLYNKYYFRLVVSASGYHQIGGFISAIENSEDIFAVEEVEIKPSPQESPGTQTTQGMQKAQEEPVVVQILLSTILVKG